MLCPAWSTSLAALQGMSVGSIRLPRVPLFLRQGWDPMPTPPWDTWVFYIREPLRPRPRCPCSTTSLLGCPLCRPAPPPATRLCTCRAASLRGCPVCHTRCLLCRGSSLLGCQRCRPDTRQAQAPVRPEPQISLLRCGDVESNPGPDPGPCADPDLENSLIRDFFLWRASDRFELLMDNYGRMQGPCGEGPDPGWRGLIAECGICYAQIYFRDLGTLQRQTDCRGKRTVSPSIPDPRHPQPG